MGARGCADVNAGVGIAVSTVTRHRSFHTHRVLRGKHPNDYSKTQHGDMPCSNYVDLRVPRLAHPVLVSCNDTSSLLA